MSLLHMNITIKINEELCQSKGIKQKTSYNEQTKHEGEFLNRSKDHELVQLLSKSTKYYYIRADTHITLKSCFIMSGPFQLRIVVLYLWD